MVKCEGCGKEVKKPVRDGRGAWHPGCYARNFKKVHGFDGVIRGKKKKK